ncbi:MAG TPA: hypothetical protein V6C63_02675 [Allocoleopsis sp.]
MRSPLTIGVAYNAVAIALRCPLGNRLTALLFPYGSPLEYETLSCLRLRLQEQTLHARSLRVTNKCLPA